MAMNQILNMIVRIFMRKMISRGIDAGIRKASGGNRKAPGPAPQQSAAAPRPQEGGLTRDEVRAQRRARRAAREAAQNQDSQ